MKKVLILVTALFCSWVYAGDGSPDNDVISADNSGKTNSKSQ